VRRRARYAAGGGGGGFGGLGGGGFGGFGGNMGQSIPGYGRPGGGCDPTPNVTSPAIPFSAGGDGVRRSPELPAQLSHVVFRQPL